MQAERLAAGAGQAGRVGAPQWHWPGAHRPQPVPQAAGYVATSLAGQQLRAAPGGKAVLPLLHPQQHGLPFGLALELHPSSTSSSGGLGTSPLARPLPRRSARSTYELRYVLGGSGHLVRPDGSSEPLEAGDTVLMDAGAAACSSADQVPSATPWQLAELVFYMPRSLFDEQRQQHGDAPPPAASHSQQWQQQQLQPPAGELMQLVAAAWEAGPPVAACLQEEEVQTLLLGAKNTARRALQELDARQQQTAQHREVQQEQQGGALERSGSDAQASTSGHGFSNRPGAPGGLLQLGAQRLVSWAAQAWDQLQDRGCPITKRTLRELTTFQLPNQTNRLALMFDPLLTPKVPLVAGIEVFEAGHRTTPHIHPTAHELFFIMSGEGEAFCDDMRMPVRAGDLVCFRPGALHGIDNGSTQRMYCLEVMLPDEHFAAFIRTGRATGGLEDEELCLLASIGCR